MEQTISHGRSHSEVNQRMPHRTKSRSAVAGESAPTPMDITIKNLDTASEVQPCVIPMNAAQWAMKPKNIHFSGVKLPGLSALCVVKSVCTRDIVGRLPV